MKMTKILSTTFIIVLFTIGIVSVSCTKDPVPSTNVELRYLGSEDTVEARNPVQFVITGEGDNLVLFTGETNKDYANLPKSRGMDNYAFGDTINYTYLEPGPKTVSAVASSYGNWGEDVKIEVSELNLYITDNNTDIVEILRKQAFLDGSGDTIITDKDTQVVMVINTLSRYSVSYPNSDKSVAYDGDTPMIVDLTVDNPHILVSSYSGAEQIYPIITVPESELPE